MYINDLCDIHEIKKDCDVFNIYLLLVLFIVPNV